MTSTTITVENIVNSVNVSNQITSINDNGAAKLSSSMEEQLISIINSIGFKCFKSVDNELNSNNLLISPLSLFSSLASIESDLITKESTNGIEEINFKFFNLKRKLESENIDKSYELIIGNKLITSEVIDDSIKEKLSFYHGTTFDTIDNVQVKNETQLKRKINELIGKDVKSELKKYIFNSVLQLDFTTEVSILIGSSYFIGSWIFPFDTMQTEERTFYNFDECSRTHFPVNVVFLCRWNHAYKVLRPKSGSARESDPKFTTLQLKYKNDIDMIIFMPSTVMDMKKLEQQLSTEFINSVTDDLILTPLHLTAIPKFSLTNCVELSNCAAGPGAIGHEGKRIKVSKILHASGINLTETGIEPIKRTEIFKDRTKPSTNPASIVIDKPFLFAVRENQTGLILYIGKITKV